MSQIKVRSWNIFQLKLDYEYEDIEWISIDRKATYKPFV